MNIYFNEPLKKLPDDTIKYYRLTYRFGTGIYPELYSVYSSPYKLKFSNDVKNYLCINMSAHYNSRETSENNTYTTMKKHTRTN